MNLLPELGVTVDLMMRGCWPGERFIGGPGRFASSMSALNSETNEFHKRFISWQRSTSSRYPNAKQARTTIAVFIIMPPLLINPDANAR